MRRDSFLRFVAVNIEEGGPGIGRCLAECLFAFFTPMYGHLFWVVYRPNLMLAPCLCACVCATPIRVFYSQGWTPVICVAVDFDLKNGPSTKKIKQSNVKQSKATLADDSRAMMARGDGSGLASRWSGVREEFQPRSPQFGHPQGRYIFERFHF